jgi:hypothetical protein
MALAFFSMPQNASNAPDGKMPMVLLAFQEQKVARIKWMHSDNVSARR